MLKMVFITSSDEEKVATLTVKYLTGGAIAYSIVKIPTFLFPLTFHQQIFSRKEDEQAHIINLKNAGLFLIFITGDQKPGQIE